MNLTRIKRYQLGIFVLSAILLLAVKLLIIRSQAGAGWEPDEFMHFLQLKTVFTNLPHNLDIGISVWAKPLYTFPMAIVASLTNGNNLIPVQVVNSLLILGVGVLVYKTLRRLGCGFWVSWSMFVATNITFLLFRSSLSGLTEPIFTFVLMSAVYLFTTKQYLLSSLLVGIGVWGRIEGALFVLIWIVALYLLKLPRKHNIQNFLALIVPAGLWNLVGFLSTGRLLYLVSNGYPVGESGIYGYGSITYYLEGMLHLEPLVLLLFCLCIPLIIKYLRNKSWHAVILASSSVAIFFILQTIFWKFGLFGTAGLMRYFIAIMPLAIIVVGMFLEHIGTSLLLNAKELIILCGAFLILQAALTGSLYFRGGLEFGQVNKPIAEPALQQAGEWLDQNAADKSIYSDHPEPIFYAGRNLEKASINVKPYWQRKAPGIYVWTTSWGKQVTGIEFGDISENAKLLTSFKDEVYIFEVN